MCFMLKKVVKSEAEIDILRKNSILVSQTLAFLKPMIQPGVKTIELDRLAEEFICNHGAKPGFKGYNGYAYTLCISINDVVVHGLPSSYELQIGDIVSIDCGTIMDAYYGDSAYTFVVGEVPSSVQSLLDVTRVSLDLGIKEAVAGNRIGDIGNAIQQYAEQNGMGVVREMVGHGIGRKMHESPMVPNYGRKGTGGVLKEGMVLCIEPMITLGSPKVYQGDDGWSIFTQDHSLCAHFEKTVVVRSASQGAEVLTDFDLID